VTRLSAALLAFATCALAQERAWQDVKEEGERLWVEGKAEEAATAMAEASRLAEAAGVAPKDRAGFENAVASMLRLVHRTEEAEAHRRKAVELLAGAVPALDPTLAAARGMLAGDEAKNGRLDEAALDACTALEAVQGEAPAVETGCLAMLARVSFGRRRYGEAMELMRLAIAKAREAEPEPGRLSFQLGSAAAALALSIGRDDLAERMLTEVNQMIEKARPNPADAAEVTRLGVELLIKQGRLEDAERGGRATLDLNAKESGSIPIAVAALTTSLARVALAQGDLKRAAECIEQAEPALRRPGYDTRSELSAFLGARAELRLRQGDRAAARSDLEEALRLDTRDGEHGLSAARTLLALARLESDDGVHARAMDHAGRATRIFLREIGPSAAEGRKACETYGLLRTRAIEAGLGDVPLLKGARLGEALEPGAEATDRKIRDLLGRASRLESRKDWAAALALADEALALRPGESTAHALRGDVLAGMRRYEDAIEAADSAIAWSLEPRAAGYRGRACLNFVLRRHDHVIVDATYALLLRDDDPAVVLRLRGIARVGRGEAELGLRSLDASLTAKPEDPGTEFFRGLALWYLERFDEAASALRIAAAAGYQRSGACARLAQYERRRGNDDESLALATESIDKGAVDVAAYGVRGFIRLDRGEWKAALTDFEAWAGDEPPSLYGRILQWICRAHLGERDAGDAALRGAIDGEKEREDLKAVARAFLGEAPAPTVDGPVPPERERREQECQAHFLLGTWREISGDPAGARAHYQRARAMECPASLEQQSAELALARLDAAK
jgi:tetratricopeptide (TPR) repeat protein